jgi:hypothetical protein
MQIVDFSGTCGLYLITIYFLIISGFSVWEGGDEKSYGDWYEVCVKMGLCWTGGNINYNLICTAQYHMSLKFVV